jgi:serine/threonine protein kinase
MAIGLAIAIDRLHQDGIIHKDIKPANVLANSVTGQCWLTGIGIASRLPRERQAPEPPEFIGGPLAYIAPEQIGRMNRSTDSRSDLTMGNNKRRSRRHLPAHVTGADLILKEFRVQESQETEFETATPELLQLLTPSLGLHSLLKNDFVLTEAKSGSTRLTIRVYLSASILSNRRASCSASTGSRSYAVLIASLSQ